MTLLLLACVDYDLNPEKEQAVPGEDPVDTGAPRLSVEPLSLDFGQELVGNASSQDVTVRNIGTEVLELDAPVLDTTLPFSVAGQGAELEPGDAVVWSVSWAPDAYVAGSAELEVFSTGGDEVVDLSGDTLRPDISISPTSHDFGEVGTGTAQAIEVVIESVGEAPLTLEQLEWNSTSGELVYADGFEPGAVLYPTQTHTLQVLFQPQDEGPEEATLTVWSDSPTNPAVSTQVQGSGLPAGPWEVSINVSADDAWEGWVDGQSLGSHSGWSSVDSFTETLGAGDHVIAIHARDVASVIAGFIAEVQIDGQPFSLTGDGSWLMTNSSPSGSWTDVSYNSSSWSTPPKCQDTSPWGSGPSALINAGAKWVWHQGNCRALGQAWFRLEFTL